jgi:3-deoxy-manno-octulosonate cytidylyltransferase (CMP-KDO synthetase)
MTVTQHTTLAASPLDLSRVLTVVPARYGSSRFPGKPLADIHGVPMVQQVVERIKESRLAESTYCVATDDTRIQEALAPFYTDSKMTDPNHPSGSDRIWEALSAYNMDDYDWVINIQGDEPFMSPGHLDTLIAAMETHQGNADIVTLVTPYFPQNEPATSVEEAQRRLSNPNMVKALYTSSGKVLYFSRLPIPCVRDGLELDHCAYDAGIYFRHLGVYAYKVSALKQFVESPAAKIEDLEKLEQLRALSLGMNIYAGVVSSAPVGVDTPEDLERLLQAGH